MKCSDLDPLLHPFLDGELIAGDRADVEAHLLGCSGCAKKVEHERLAVDLIRSRAREAQPKAPEALKQRLLDGIHREEAASSRRAAARWAAAAAAAGIAVFAGQREWRQLQCRLDMDDAAGLHARQYPLDVEAKSDQLEPMLSGKLGYHVAVPNIPNATATGARFIQMRGGKDAVLIRYTVAGHRQPLSLVVYGDEPEHVTEPEYDQTRGYNTVTWHDGNVGYHLLTDLDEQDIRQLVPPPHGTKLPTLDARPAALNH